MSPPVMTPSMRITIRRPYLRRSTQALTGMNHHHER